MKVLEEMTSVFINISTVALTIMRFLTVGTALVIAAMTASVFFAPSIVFAQLPPIELPPILVVTPEATQTIETNTGGNTQFNIGSQNQAAENSVNIVSAANADGKKSEAKAETTVKDSTINTAIIQEQTQTQVNAMEDNDNVEVDAQNAAGGLLAANVNIEDILIDILGGGDLVYCDAIGCRGEDPVDPR